ncbi:MAG TPA: hypothetical protein H9765_01960 [Candidatus Mediterraneibacter intestinigallinarum]|nr:hypothetical protein [Candidatus Mediterraneibacter intestinigallinarum]
MSSTIRVIVDDELKGKSDSLFKDLEIDTNILKKLDESKEHADHGQCRRADDVVADMRRKYGL